MKNKTMLIIAIVAIAMILIGSVGLIVVKAQTASPPVTPQPVRQPVRPTRPARGLVLPQVELDAPAKALGMGSTDLAAELKAGKSLAAIATEKGVDLKTVQAAIQAARLSEWKAQIAQAVKDGQMTQAKADWLIEGLDKGYIDGLGGTFVQPGPRMQPGLGLPGRFGRPAGSPPGQITPQPLGPAGQG